MNLDEALDHIYQVKFNKQGSKPSLSSVPQRQAFVLLESKPKFKRNWVKQLDNDIKQMAVDLKWVCQT